MNSEKGQIALFRAKQFVRGVWSGLQLWKCFTTSRTLKLFALKALPLYVTTVLIGIYFTVLGNVDNTHVVLNKGVWLIAWGIPIYVVGTLLQGWYVWNITKIASDSTKAMPEKRNPTVTISEGLYGVLLSFTYLVQTFLFNFVAKSILPNFCAPFISTAISIVMIAWTTAFTAFDCKLILKNYDLFRRIHFVETRWAYALGYGLPASLVYHFFPGVFALGVWQYLQLLLTLRAVSLSTKDVSDPFSGGASKRVNGHRLRMFRFAQYLASIVLSWIKIKSH